ncbi:MAG: NAD-dependent epimerase/dehydratase family protein [Bdellovibrionales bacterium]|nr:NAD-dependent epimerase/dehydratase family protein [Bdellovibrionales bacterium]
MRYLVTGGTGFLGRFVARELKLRGHSATFLTRKKTAVDHLEADLTAWDAGLDIKNLKGQYDILLHMAGLYNLRVSEDDAVLSNVIGTHTALTLAEKAEIPHFVHISTVAVTVPLPTKRPPSCLPHYGSAIGFQTTMHRANPTAKNSCATGAATFPRQNSFYDLASSLATRKLAPLNASTAPTTPSTPSGASVVYSVHSRQLCRSLATKAQRFLSFPSTQRRAPSLSFQSEGLTKAFTSPAVMGQPQKNCSSLRFAISTSTSRSKLSTRSHLSS